MQATEFLRSVTADGLNEVVRAELSAFNEQAPGSVHITHYLVAEYPQLADFILELADGLSGAEGAEPSEDLLLFM